MARGDATDVWGGTHADGGQIARLCGIVMLGFWTGAALIMVRRPRNPNPTDLRLIRYAFVPLFAVSMVIAIVMQR